MPSSLRDIAIRESATLRSAMEAIDRGAVEIAFVVDEGQRLLGTLTDGDVRRALLGGASLENPAERFMQRQFTAVGPSVSRAEVLDLMRARTLGQIPIVDDEGRLAGLHLMREILGAEPRPNWAVVMAGGRGERLRPITDSLPKPMIKVAGRPILERIVLHLVGSGIRRIYLSINYMGDVIEKHFKDGAAFGCRIEYLKEEKPLGTGGALSLLPEVPEAPVVVLNGDLLTQFSVGGLLDFHAEGGYKATIGVCEYLHTVPFGVIEREGDQVTGLSEKPTHSWLASTGIYALDASLIVRVPKDTFFPITGLLEDCMDRGEPVGAFQIESDWIDVGRPKDLFKAIGRE